MALQYDQLTNTLSVNDTVNANSSLNLVGQGTGAVNLKGTGQNLVLQSQALATSPWTPNGITATNNSATAPDNTSTASLITATAGTSAHYDFSGGTPAYNQNITYTVSFYAKSGTTRYVQFGIGGTGSIYANFDITSGTVGTTAGLTSSSITFVGNGWYRCVCVFSYALTGTTGVAIAIQSSSSDTRLQSWTAVGTETVYIWGVQTEIGSVANIYVPTTSTVVYGTPSLSFSGVAGVGLQSDGSLYVSPAGTGAIQAQATTSSATGGNARGANAVDWQTARGNANQVAGSAYSAILGGSNNRAGNSWTVVNGGYNNAATGNISYVGGGSNNISSSDLATVIGGQSNIAGGYYNLIGGGVSNSGTSASAVTTQGTTTVTSGSTAVTLSGSNASIKVGQLITGTGINSYTYVAAISGTSLTLSQNASASGTPTLSFFTPHGVVVGGGNNQATGAYSFIGGGGDAGTAANRNVASADWSTVVGGVGNQATGIGAFVGGGGVYLGTVNGNNASGVFSVVGGGLGNQTSGQGAFIGGGYTNYANGNYSVVNGYNGTSRGIDSAFILSSRNSNNTQGFSQSGWYNLSVSTTTTGAVALSSNSNAAGTTNQVVLPNGQTGTVSVYTFRVLISAHNSANTTDIAGWQILGVISRGNGVGTTALVGTPTVTLLGATSGAISAGWGTLSNVAAVADTTNGALQIQVTGVASTTIRWSARVETNELAY